MNDSLLRLRVEIERTLSKPKHRLTQTWSDISSMVNRSKSLMDSHQLIDLESHSSLDLDPDIQCVLDQLVLYNGGIYEVVKKLTFSQQEPFNSLYFKSLISKISDFIEGCPDSVLLKKICKFLNFFMNEEILFIYSKNKFNELFFQCNKSKTLTIGYLLGFLQALEILQSKLNTYHIICLLNESLEQLVISETDDFSEISEMLLVGHRVQGIIMSALQARYELMNKTKFQLELIDCKKLKLERRAVDSRTGVVRRDNYRGIYKNKYEVIVKEYSGKIDENQLKNFEQEAMFLQILSEKMPCFLKFFGIMKSPNKFSLVMEYCPMTLEKDIEIRKKRHLRYTLEEFCRIAVEILDGLIYMEENNICHRDVKPQNMFLSSENVKIGDFSISSFLDLKFGRLPAKIQCTIYYSSPEIKDPTCSSSSVKDLFKSDVYSLGITFHEMLFLGQKKLEVIENDFKNIQNNDIRALLLKMIDKDYHARPSFSQCQKILKEVYPYTKPY